MTDVTTILIGNHKVHLNKDEDYLLFEREVTYKEIVDYDFDYLTDTHKLVLAKLLDRANEVPIIFNRDIHDSLMEERENSPFYKKTPYEASIIYRRTSTVDTRLAKEENTIKQKIDLTSQVVRNRRNKSVNHLVDMGYDRATVMDVLSDMIKELGSGLMALTPTRIAERVDERMIAMYNAD